MSTEKLFPEYLNKGSKGPAVSALQLVLLVLGYNKNIIVDGDYGEETAKGVMKLQYDIGMDDEDHDGHFGPKTRAAFLDYFAFDIDAILVTAFSCEAKYIGP